MENDVILNRVIAVPDLINQALLKLILIFLPCDFKCALCIIFSAYSSSDMDISIQSILEMWSCFACNSILCVWCLSNVSPADIESASLFATFSIKESKLPIRVLGVLYKMTSSNGNIFRVTGPLWGEFTGPGEFPTQRPVTRSFDVSLICVWINGWVNNREAGDLRRHRGYYDVNVMFCTYSHWVIYTFIPPLLTHLTPVTHICLAESGHHWFRYRLLACSAPNHMDHPMFVPSESPS